MGFHQDEIEVSWFLLIYHHLRLNKHPVLGYLIPVQLSKSCDRAAMTPVQF